MSTWVAGRKLVRRVSGGYSEDIVVTIWAREPDEMGARYFVMIENGDAWMSAWTAAWLGRALEWAAGVAEEKMKGRRKKKKAKVARAKNHP